MLRKIMASYRKIIFSATSALLLALSFSSWNLSFLAWIGMVPLFFAMQGCKPKQVFLIAYFCGFIFFLSSMYWLVFVTPFGWIALSLYQAFYFGIFGSLAVIARGETSVIARREAPKQSHSSILTYLIIPSIWCILEWLRSCIAGGIGWNLLGYSQYQNTPIIQIADITGAYGVSFLIVIVNFTIYAAIRMAIKCQKTHKSLFVKSTMPFRHEIKVNPLIQTFIVFLIIVSALFYGNYKLESLSDKRQATTERLKISVVQGNINQIHKWDASYKDYILEKYRVLTREAAKDSPQLIVWPETSVPGYPDIDLGLSRYIRNIAKSANTQLLVGAPVAALENGKDLGNYNSAQLFSGKGDLLKQYNKLHLVAFGEFIPFEKYFPFLRDILPLTGNFVSGVDYTMFSLRTPNSELLTQFGVLICFEDIFPSMVRRFVKDGADFMVNITNDAWFEKTSAAYQHAANSVFRAVENRRPFVRSANTGLSCFIDRMGNIYASVKNKAAELFVDGYRSDYIDINPAPPMTFYTRFGDIFVLICGFLAGLFLIDYIRRGGYNKKLL